MKYQIKLSDVGKTAVTSERIECSCCNVISTQFPYRHIGVVTPSDVGKICYTDDSGQWTVETDRDFIDRVVKAFIGKENEKKKLSIEWASKHTHPNAPNDMSRISYLALKINNL